MRARKIARTAGIVLIVTLVSTWSFAQRTDSSSSLGVPRWVRFTGSVRDTTAGTIGITFSLYKQEQGGAPLWLETQNVSVDANGRFAVVLGANHADGIPADLFTAGEAQWLGVQPDGRAEQPRVLLVSVPYALKAGDADTLGGKPLSAFLLAAQQPASMPSTNLVIGGPTLFATPDVTNGAANYLPKFSDATNLTTSTIVDSAGKIGIGTAAPESILDIAGNSSQTVRFGTVPWALRIGQLQSGTQFIGIAVKRIAKDNNYIASSTNISTVNHTVMEFGYDGSMRLKQQSHQVDGTVLALSTTFAMTPAGSIGIGVDKPVQKLEVAGNLKINGTGNGITFPDGTVQKTAATTATGGSTLTGISAGIGLTGGGTSGTPVLSLNTTYTDGRYAQVAVGNIFNGNQEVAGTLKINGTGNGIIFPDGSVQKTANSGTGGGGTLTGISAGTGLSGGGTSGTPVLSLNTAYTDARYAAVGTGNTFTGSQVVHGGLAIDGGFSSGSQVANGDITASGVVSGAVLSATSVQAHVGVAPGGIAMSATADADDGTGLDVLASSATGASTAIHATVNSALGFAGIFDNVAAGSIILGRVKIGDYWVKRFRVDGGGRVYANGGVATGGADFAESFAVNGAKADYEPGDVLVIDVTGTRRLTRSQEPYSALVAGVYSTRPGLLASPYDMDDPNLGREVPLAVVGVVPCKVTAENGPIKTGDLLVTSSAPGYAMKGTDRSRMLGAVIGKALQSFESGTGVIEVLVTVH